jgi:PilZ domain
MGESQKFGQDQRAAFRIAIKGNVALDAQLVFAGQKLHGSVGDVSAEGLFITLDRGALPALKVDALVDVEITFEGETLALYGVIRSQRAGGYGIFFPERDPAGRANPVARFGRISAQLQRSSLSQRLKVLKLPP